MNHQERRREQRKGFSRNFDRHHRVCKSRKDDPLVKGYDVHSDENIVYVPSNHHRNHHCCFANMLSHEIAAVLTQQWIDPRSSMIAIWNKQGVQAWLDEGRKMGFLYG